MLGSSKQEIDAKICNGLGLKLEIYNAMSYSENFKASNDYLTILKLTNKALASVANSPAQLKIRKQIDRIRNKYINL